MKIFIPTKGRVGQQTTLNNLPADLQIEAVLVCPESEAAAHRKEFPYTEVLVQPEDIFSIGQKRQWIVERAKTEGIERVVMLDDDLRFAVRRVDDPGLFRKAEDEDILGAFAELAAILDAELPHAGFSARGAGIGNSAKKGGWQLGKRMMYVLGYHVETVLNNAIFGRIDTHEDMDICLQLLSAGFPNMVNFSFVVDQKFGSPGGCSDERTIEKSNADCEKLQSFHPEYVRVEEKTYIASTPRKEVVCSWQKAMYDGFLLR